jgi:DNA-binding SARP family transcriptional activator
MLLGLLAVERGRLARMDRMVDALWPGAPPPRRPVQDIATMVSRLRSRIGSDSILGGGSGYRLGDRVGVDLHQAGGLVDVAEARTRPDAALVSARQALDLLDRGDVLEDWPEVKWAESARGRHAALTRRARHVAAGAALQMGDMRTARDMAEAATAADPFDEPACRLLMRAHVAAGETARALLAYEVLRTTLAVELGADPGPQTSELHVAILNA